MNADRAVCLVIGHGTTPAFPGFCPRCGSLAVPRTPSGGDTQPEGGPMAGRPGRPAVGTKVAVRIPDDVLVVVDKLAADAGTNRSAWIRDAVADAVTTRKDSTR